MSTRKFRHVGIVTRDIVKSLKFYRKLGLSLIKEQLEDQVYINKLLGTKGVCLRTYKLGCNEIIMVELLEFLKGDISHRENNVLLTGITHFALQVENLESLYSRLVDTVKFISNPLLSPDGSVKVVYCQDPDQNYIELVEELKII